MASSTNPPEFASVPVPGQGAQLTAEHAAAVESAFVRALKSVDLNSRRLWIAYSGGLDSTVLLHLAAAQHKLGVIKELSAIHVDHNIAADSGTWAQHCAHHTDQLQIPLTLSEIPMGELASGNLEQRARQARYQLIEQALAPTDLLLTAHHRDDQAETVLLQQFRGGGVRGTAAMGELTTQHGLQLFRPLLDIDPRALRGYARHHQLSWVEDPSNKSFEHDRNYLRLQVLPILRQRWPGIDQTLARTAQLHAQSSELADDLAALDLVAASAGTSNSAEDPSSGSISCEYLNDLSPARRNNLLRYWLAAQGFSVPGAAQLRELIQSLLFSREDRSPIFSWGSAQVYRYRGELFATKRRAGETDIAVRPWQLTQPLAFNELGWQLSARQATEGPRMNWPTGRSLTVGFRQGGETLQLRGHHHKLKKLFQEWQIAPANRQRLPLIFDQQELLAVAGYAVADSVRARDQEQGWRLIWQPI